MNAPPIDRGAHHAPDGTSARVALGFTKVPRWTADTLFAERYDHREAMISYANPLTESEEEGGTNIAASEFAKRYGRLPDDEAHHRDVTHGFANEAR